MLVEPSHYRTAAKESLSKTEKSGRVILVHTGAVLLLSLLMTAVDYFLDQQISTTGGLSGMELRSILSTIQSSLRLFQFILLPFWQVGYTYYTLRVAQRESVGYADLLQGFRRFGSVLRLKLLFVGIAFLLTMASSYVGSLLFALTPWSAPLIQDLESLMGGTLDETALMNAVYSLSPQMLLPLMVSFSVCFLVGGVFLFYRFRLAELWLMDHPTGGVLKALRSSGEAMRGNFKGMLKIDLSFWWFYLLEIVVTTLCFGNVFLDGFGMEMTADAFTHYLIFFSLYVWAQMALYWWKRNEVCVTYAHAYMALCPKESEKETVSV